MEPPAGRVAGGFELLQGDFLDDLRVVLVFQQAQAFQAEYFGEERLVDVAVGGFHIVAACSAIGRQWTAANPEVVPARRPGVRLPAEPNPEQQTSDGRSPVLGCVRSTGKNWPAGQNLGRAAQYPTGTEQTPNNADGFFNRG